MEPIGVLAVGGGGVLVGMIAAYGLYHLLRWRHPRHRGRRRTLRDDLDDDDWDDNR